LTIRYGFVGYRDHGDDEEIISIDFDTSDRNIKEKINSIQAYGGGDIPENVTGGLVEALQLHWNDDHAQIIFHIGDAPCHNYTDNKFHDLPIGNDSFEGKSHPENYDSLPIIRDYIKLMNLTYVFFKKSVMQQIKW